MTPAELLASMHATFTECLAIAERKNHDYAGESDALRNLKGCEYFGLCSLEIGVAVRMTDKFTRICNLMTKPAAVADESLEDSILDFINYLAILRSARHARQETDAR